MDTRTTRMTSPEEKSQSSSNVAPRPGETWGAFFARLTPEELSDWYDPTISEAELDEAFGTPYEELYKKITGEELPETAKPGTQGDLWDEIAEEGYDSLDGLWDMRAKKKRAQAEAATASTAPIIADGKTLDELVKGDKFMERITRDSRAEGATDQEIWQFFQDT